MTTHIRGHESKRNRRRSSSFPYTDSSPEAGRGIEQGARRPSHEFTSASKANAAWRGRPRSSPCPPPSHIQSRRAAFNHPTSSPFQPNQADLPPSSPYTPSSLSHLVVPWSSSEKALHCGGGARNWTQRALQEGNGAKKQSDSMYFTRKICASTRALGGINMTRDGTAPIFGRPSINWNGCA